MNKIRSGRTIIFGLVILLLLVQVSIIVIAYGRSKLWANAGSAISVLHLPLGTINASTISYSLFKNDFQSARRAEQNKDVTDDQLRSGVWLNLIRETIFQQIARENKLEISSHDSAEAERSFMSSVASAEQKDELWHLYGLTPRQAVDRFVKPLAIEERVRRWYAELPNTVEHQNIEMLSAQLHTDASNFDEIAAALADPESKKVTEHLVPEEDLQDSYQQLASLKVGEVSSIIASPDGYRLFKVNNIVAGEDGKKYFQLHELFVPLNSFEAFIDEQIKKAQTKIYFPDVVGEIKL